MRGMLGSGTPLATAWAMSFLACACGGGTPPPATPSSEATPPPTVAASPPPVAPAPGSTAPAPGPAAAKEPDLPLDDPNEKPGPIAMVPEFDKTRAKASFPKKGKPDAQCWAQVPVTGDHTKDYAAVVAACGTPTGLVEYARPVEGKLHHKHDPSDVFTMPVFAGYCYRYFAIADATITDLDLLIEKKGGALVGDDKTTSPFAIIDGDQSWCQDEDLNLEFHIVVDGPGKGGYTFGVWARPKR